MAFHIYSANGKGGNISVEMSWDLYTLVRVWLSKSREVGYIVCSIKVAIFSQNVEPLFELLGGNKKTLLGDSLLYKKCYNSYSRGLSIFTVRCI